MSDNIEKLEGNGFELNGDGQIVQSLDYTSQLEAESFKEKLELSMPKQVNFNVYISDTSYERVEDVENEVNGWVVVDIAVETQDLENENELVIKAIIDAVDNASSSKQPIYEKIVIGTYKDDNQHFKNKITLKVEVSAKTGKQLSSVDAKTVIENGYTLSISGDITSGNKDISAGQIQDDILEQLDNIDFAPGFTKESVRELLIIWDKYHLNDLNAGTNKQTEIINNAFAKAGKSYDYETALKILETYSGGNMLTDNGYKYGTKWLFKKLPAGVVPALKNILSGEVEVKKEETKTIEPK